MPLSSSRLGLCFWSGTAGFSFDAFGYVLKAVSQKGHWPGAKALPEMQAYFANRKKSMPSQGKAIIFHRVGIFGVRKAQKSLNQGGLQ